MKITYNSPLILTYALISLTVLLLQQYVSDSTMGYFTSQGAGSFSFSSLTDYFRLFSHAIGHGGWDHLFGNFMFILAIGPLIEEKYGSDQLLGMMLVTALISGILNVTISPNGVLGASGIVFMLILLGSFTNLKDSRTIPMTFILIFALYLGKEIMAYGANDGVSHFGHILGGVCGSIFGFIGKKADEYEQQAS